MKTKEELKNDFKNGDKPVQEQFWEWMDSYWHKKERITQDSIDWIAANEQFMYSPSDSGELIGISKEIVFPEGTKTIGAYIFSFGGIVKNYITKVVFPDSLEKIKTGAFNLQYLKGSLRIPGSCKIIEERAFNGALRDVTELILEEGIENIGVNAFQQSGSSNLSDLYIPNSVKSLGVNAFAITSLVTVSVPSGLDISNAGIPDTATITYRSA